MKKIYILINLLIIVFLIGIFLPIELSEKELFRACVSKNFDDKIFDLKSIRQKGSMDGITYFAFEALPQTFIELKKELKFEEGEFIEEGAPINPTQKNYSLDAMAQKILSKPFGWYLPSLKNSVTYYVSIKENETNLRYLITNLEKTKYIIVFVNY